MTSNSFYELDSSEININLAKHFNEKFSWNLKFLFNIDSVFNKLQNKEKWFSIRAVYFLLYINKVSAQPNSFYLYGINKLNSKH